VPGVPAWDDLRVLFGVHLLAPEASDLAVIAQTVEDLGFESLFLPEHTHCAVSHVRTHPAVAEYYGQAARMVDPFAALGSVASVTRSLRLGTAICLVPQHDPIVLAKQVATVDRLSAGRVLFGIGAGWVPAETHNHGLPFRRRFDVMREHVLAMKVLWTGEECSYAGEFVRFEGARSLEPVQRPHPPILVGGMGKKALAAVHEYGDGWLPIHPFDRIDLVATLETTVCVFAGCDDDDVLERYAAAGVHRCVVVFPAGDRAALKNLASRAARYP
jgi:probable F420-dependent oxidoreductase